MEEAKARRGSEVAKNEKNLKSHLRFLYQFPKNLPIHHLLLSLPIPIRIVPKWWSSHIHSTLKCSHPYQIGCKRWERMRIEWEYAACTVGPELVHKIHHYSRSFTDTHLWSCTFDSKEFDFVGRRFGPEAPEPWLLLCPVDNSKCQCWVLPQLPIKLSS